MLWIASISPDERGRPSSRPPCSRGASLAAGARRDVEIETMVPPKQSALLGRLLAFRAPAAARRDASTADQAVADRRAAHGGRRGPAEQQRDGEYDEAFHHARHGEAQQRI